MSDWIINWFQALAPREKRLVMIAGVSVCVFFLFAVLFPLDHSVTRAHERVVRKQGDLAWMKSVAPQLAALPPPLAGPTSQSSMIALIDSSAREAGLGTSLTNSEPSGQGGLRVRLDKAPFDTLVAWLARLAEQRGIHVESATVDSAGAPGLVNAGIVLRAAQ